MLSKYKQTYNNLTHTEFFVEGNKKSKEINKSKFTPHNLKSVIFGANGLLAIYYTTNELNRNLVEWMPFKTSNNYFYNTEGVFMEEKYLGYLSVVDKEKKGMVDALHNELRFNFVEEIFILVDDFLIEQERNFEIARLNELYNSIKFKKVSMKRLNKMGVLKIADPVKFKEGLKKLKPKKSIDSQLDDLGLKVVESYPLNPERTELGLLFNPGLDASEYGPDQKYDPNTSDCAKNINCRLSKYFYDEEQAAIARKKKKEEDAKQAALLITQEELNQILNNLWLDVKPIYEELYRNAIEYGLIGILTPTGYIGYDKENKNLYTNNNDIWVKNIANSISDYDGYKKGQRNKQQTESAFEIRETKKFEDLDLSTLEEFNYFSRFHAKNAFGILPDGKKTRNWDLMQQVIEKRFKKIAKTFLSKADKSNITKIFNTIEEKLTNCILIEKFDRNTCISMKYKMSGLDIGYNAYFEMNCTNIVGKQQCKILNSHQSQNNVITMFGVFDVQKFASEALFSYQAYEDMMKVGKRPSLSNTIIGRNLDGTQNVINLAGNDTRLIGMFAQSGAGKGVMTLGILTSIIANKVPFIYLDYKPDMAEMLWNIEKDFKAKGITRTDGKECRILAVDAKSDIADCSPVRGHSFGENAPSYMSEITATEFAVLPYLKLMQLYYLLSDVRQNLSQNEKSAFGGKMTFAILDELQQNAMDNLENFQAALSRAKKSAKNSKNENLKDIENYVNKVESFIAKLAAATGTYVNTTGRKANCRAFYIGQNADYNLWVNQKRPLTSEIYKKTSFRFFGRNGGTGSYAPANTGSILEFVNNKSTFGYWTSVTGANKVDNIKNWEVFKAYSVLNENDFNIDNPSDSGRFTSGVLNNISDETVREDLVQNVFVMNDADGNKVIRPEVGFLGLIKKLSGFSDNELADALSEGYEVIWKVMCKYGMDALYPDVESYLFDTSLEGILSTDDIKSGLKVTKKEEAKTYENIKVFDEIDMEVNDAGIDFDFETTEDIKPQQESKKESNSFEVKEDSERKTPSKPQINRNNNAKTPSDKDDTFNYEQQRKKSPTSISSNAYRGTLKISPNPFGKYNDGKTLGTLNITKAVTEQIVENINEVIGPPDTITDFKVTKDGVLVFNDISYMPSFESAFIESLPLAIRNKVETGALIDLFDLREVYRYKNLSTFVLERESFAQGRARKEMGIGFRKKWSVLFKKFGLLTYIKVGSVEYVRDNPDTGAENKFLDLFKRNPQATYNTSLSESRMDRVWDSKPVRIITSAVGWTLGVQAVWAIAGLFGPWGLLFGAIAAAQTYTTVTGRSPTDRLREPSVESKNSKSKKRSK